MSEHRIFARKLASRRYQVTHCFAHATRTIPDAHADIGFTPPGDTLSIASARHYRPGCIINPTKVIRELIAARRQA